MAQSEDMRNIKLTLVLYVVIAVIKLIVFAITGVIALFAEALHTVAEVAVPWEIWTEPARHEPCGRQPD